MLKTLCALVLTAFALSSSAETEISGWRHQNLRSAEGATITIDYQIVHDTVMSNKPSESYKMSPVVINVRGEGLSARDSIRAVVVNKMKNYGACGGPAYDWEESTYVDLVAAPEGHFYGDLTTRGFRREALGIRYNLPVGALALAILPYCRREVSQGQTIAVVVNGHWLVDPISHSTNFLVDLGGDVAARYRR